jgi:hypothetical protein
MQPSEMSTSPGVEPLAEDDVPARSDHLNRRRLVARRQNHKATRHVRLRSSMSSSPRTMYRPRRRTKKIYIERSPEQADDGLARMDHSIGSRPQKANHTMRHVRLSTIAPTEPRGLVCRKNIEPSRTDAILINRLHDSDRKSIVGPEDYFHCCIASSLSPSPSLLGHHHVASRIA